NMGLGNIRARAPLAGCPPVTSALGAYGTLQERAEGKDSATGHWAFMGLVLDSPLRTYPDGFPPDLVSDILRRWQVDSILGNCAASGTRIIYDLGEEHLRTGAPIVYTSADPVLQIATHLDVVPLKTLYRWC